MNKFKIFASAVILALAFVFVFGVGNAYATTGCFPDANGHWAETFICWLKDNAITGGYPDGTYKPDNNITRAEMAVFLQKTHDKAVSEALVQASTATFAFEPVPVNFDVTLTNITVNGGSITAPVAVGDNVQIELDYSVVPPVGCPGCISQIVIGFASENSPAVCIVSNGGSFSGHASFTLTTPSTGGTHYISYARTLEFTCTDALSNAPWSTLTPVNYIGLVSAY